MNTLITLNVWLGTHAHLSCRGDGGRWYFEPFQVSGGNCAEEFASTPGNRGLRWKDSLFLHSYTFPYIMHLMHLCYANEAWWREFHQLEMEFQLPLLCLLLLVVMNAAGGAALHTEENPLHSNLVELTCLAFLYFMCLFYAVERWAGKCWEGWFKAGKTGFRLIHFPKEFCGCVCESTNSRLCLFNEPSGTWWKILIIHSFLHYQCTFPDLAHFEHI